MRTATMAAMAVFVVVPIGTPTAQQGISGVQMDFYETRTRAGAVIREMSGSFFLATDGSWRMERVLRGEQLIVLSLASSGEQIEINPDLGVAVRGPVGAGLTVPTIQGYGPTVIERSFSTPTPPLRSGSVAEERMQSGGPLASYGQRAVGLLLLDGEGWAMDGHEVERWTYRLSGTTTVTLEYTATHTAENGVQTVDRRTVTNWERVTLSLGAFDVPGGLRVYSRWPER